MTRAEALKSPFGSATGRELFGSNSTAGMLGDSRGQTSDRVLIFFFQHPVIAQNLLLDNTQIIDRHRCVGSGQHVKYIYTLGSNSSQVISLWSTVTVLVLALGIGFNPTDLTEAALRKPETFSFFP